MAVVDAGAHPPPKCMRCGVTATRENPLDRLLLHFDDVHMESQRGELCRRCSTALVRWLDLPPDVRAARAAVPTSTVTPSVTHHVVEAHAPSPVADTRRVARPRTLAIVEEDEISYGDTTTVDAKALIQQIDGLLNGDNGISYAWASDSLEGIRETVEKSGHATREQQIAVENIEEGGIRGARRHGRY